MDDPSRPSTSVPPNNKDANLQVENQTEGTKEPSKEKPLFDLGTPVFGPTIKQTSSGTLPFRARNFGVPTESNIPAPGRSASKEDRAGRRESGELKELKELSELSDRIDSKDLTVESKDRLANKDLADSDEQIESDAPIILRESSNSSLDRLNEDDLAASIPISDEAIKRAAANSKELINQMSDPNKSIEPVQANKGEVPATKAMQTNTPPPDRARKNSLPNGALNGAPTGTPNGNPVEPSSGAPSGGPNDAPGSGNGAPESSQDPSALGPYKTVNGQPVKILEIDPESKQIVFNESELKEIFEKNEAMNKPICVCSIAGDYRKGKSFLLNYCLRFLQNNTDFLNRLVPEVSNQWLGHVDEQLQGFGWRSGCDMETFGIWIWSELFACKVPKNIDLLKTGASQLDTIVRSTENGKKLERNKSLTDDDYEDAFICLLDSQGAFDERSTISDCSTIFSVLFLISSMQIYNVFHQLQEDNLQYLQLFTEYGRLIYEEGIHCKPFQRLTFLVRDWFSPSEFDYGSSGGEEYLTKKFRPDVDRRKPKTAPTKQSTSSKFPKKSNETPRENQLTRVHIKRCFDKIDCFLLPHPGKLVASSKAYNGNWGDMQYEFLVKMKEFIEWWFSDLQVKRSTDYLPHKVTGGEFITFLRLLVNKLNEHSAEVLRPVTIFESMAKISHINAVDECVKQFQSKMNALFGSERPFVWPANIDKISRYLEEQHRTTYLKKKKFGNRQFEREFISRLNDQFKEICGHYQNLNELKCTVLPAYLLIVCIIVITHIFSTLLQLFVSFWPLTYLTRWLLTVEVALLTLAVCVEILGIRAGSGLVGLMRKRLQCVYHLARAKSIDLTILNSVQ